ncbi:6218_t:CDS:1, partial [Entrophospora sp. SA101]
PMVDDHFNTKTHKAEKNLYENKQRQLQQTLDTSLSSSESKKNKWQFIVDPRLI